MESTGAEQDKQMEADGASRPSAEGISVSVAGPPSSLVWGGITQCVQTTIIGCIRSRGARARESWVPLGATRDFQGPRGRCGGCGVVGDVRARGGSTWGKTPLGSNHCLLY